MTKYMHEAFKVPRGWVYSPMYDHFQKVNNLVYAYVGRQMFGPYITQLYLRGTTGMCSLEARSMDVHKLFDLAEEWLYTYGNDTTGFTNNLYSPLYEKGWQGANIDLLNA